ncbi:MAG: hypothetical protein KJ638_12085 [Chloroflexi bacterium]|nr:hypothetical protein [Chloroflexota bacterium]
MEIGDWGLGIVHGRLGIGDWRLEIRDWRLDVNVVIFSPLLLFASVLFCSRL